MSVEIAVVQSVLVLALFGAGASATVWTVRQVVRALGRR